MQTCFTFLYVQLILQVNILLKMQTFLDFASTTNKKQKSHRISIVLLLIDVAVIKYVTETLIS